MIHCETKKMENGADELTVTIGEGKKMTILREFSTICGELRNRFYENGMTPEQTNDALFTAFKVGVEDESFYPYSKEAKQVVNKYASIQKRELPE